MTYMLIRNKQTRKPVSYSSMPVPDTVTELIKAFCAAQPLEVRTYECDGTREALHTGFKTQEGWRDAKT